MGERQADLARVLAPLALNRSEIAELDGRLESYFQELQKWQRVQNLVSRETLDGFWERHALDSLQVAPILGSSQRPVLDLGSGGGFPALPLAMALAGKGTQFHLLEATARKCSFLRHVARHVGLGNVHVYNARIEEFDFSQFQEDLIITSRATASLEQLLDWLAPHWQNGWVGVFHKGQNYGAEIEKARAMFDFDVLEKTSETSSESVILQINDLSRR